MVSVEVMFIGEAVGGEEEKPSQANDFWRSDEVPSASTPGQARAEGCGYG